jgi:hypothetical protein
MLSVNDLPLLVAGVSHFQGSLASGVARNCSGRQDLRKACLAHAYESIAGVTWAQFAVPLRA